MEAGWDTFPSLLHQKSSWTLLFLGHIFRSTIIKVCNEHSTSNPTEIQWWPTGPLAVKNPQYLLQMFYELNANPGTVLKSDKGPVVGHHCIFYIKFHIELNTGCRWYFHQIQTFLAYFVIESSQLFCSISVKKSLSLKHLSKQ